MKRLIILALFTAPGLFAQTPDYIMTSSRCQSNFTRPTSFYQFTCNIMFVLQGGSTTGEMIGTNVVYFDPVGFGSLPGNPYLSKKSVVLKDVPPGSGSDGQATWEWQVQTQDGLYHVGVLNMTWNLGSCTRSGCLVIVKECDTTVDSSTVAILD